MTNPPVAPRSAICHDLMTDAHGHPTWKRATAMELPMGPTHEATLLWIADEADLNGARGDDGVCVTRSQCSPAGGRDVRVSRVSPRRRTSRAIRARPSAGRGGGPRHLRAGDHTRTLASVILAQALGVFAAASAALASVPLQPPPSAL